MRCAARARNCRLFRIHGTVQRALCCASLRGGHERDPLSSINNEANGEGIKIEGEETKREKRREKTREMEKESERDTKNKPKTTLPSHR